jgi:hypothetical protein
MDINAASAEKYISAAIEAHKSARCKKVVIARRCPRLVPPRHTERSLSTKCEQGK